jgi:energy-coupling factor transporter transmembrane protein EcfT
LWFFVYFAPKLPDKKTFYNSIISCLLLLLFFTFVVLIFKIPTLWLISFSFAFVFLIILAFAWKSNLKFVYLIISLIFFRILFDLVYLPVKSKSGDSYKEKINGIKVAKIAELYNQNLYYYGKDKLPHGLLFYIEKTKKEILKRNLTLNKNNLYLSKPEYMKGIKFYKLFQFEVKNKKYILFRPVE